MANSLNVILSLDTKPFESAIKRVEGRLNAFAKGLSSAGSALTQSITLPLAAVGAVAVKSFAEIEKLQKALAAVTGLAPDSAELRAELEKLRKVAEAPGLGFEQAVRASARLQAVGFSADQARETITQFGNAVARSGGGREEFDGTIRALSQIAAKGKVYAEEINQINERIFEIRPALQAAFGTSNTEELAKLGVSSEEFIAKITQEFTKLERVNGGLANSFENFKDAATISFSTIGKEINRLFDLQGIIDRVSKSLQVAADWFAGLDDSVKKNIIRFALFAAAIGPALLVIGKLTSVFALALTGIRNLAAGVRLLASGLALLFSPIGLVIAGVAAIAAGLVYAYQKSESFRRVVNALLNTLAELGRIAKESFAALIRGFGELKEGNLRAAAKSFGEAIVKGNPIGIALTQGERLGKAFSEGFADESSRIDEGINRIKEVFQSAKKSITGSLGGSDAVSGASSFDDNFERPGASGTAQSPQPSVVVKSENLAPLKTISEAQVAIDELNKFLEQQDARFESANAKASALGLTYEDLSKQVGLANTSIEGLVPGLGQVNNLLTRSQEIAANAKQAFIDFGNNISNAVNQGLADVAAGIGETLGDIASGTGNLKGIGNVIANLMEQVGKAAIALGIQLAAIRLSIKSLNPALAIIGGTLLVAAAKLFRNKIEGAVPKLAQGGIIPPGFPNDTFPALLSSGEAVIPLDKLGGIGGATRLTGTFLIRGEDLELSLERTKQEKERIK